MVSHWPRFFGLWFDDFGLLGLGVGGALEV